MRIVLSAATPSMPVRGHFASSVALAVIGWSAPAMPQTVLPSPPAPQTRSAFPLSPEASWSGRSQGAPRVAVIVTSGADEFVDEAPDAPAAQPDSITVEHSN